MNIQNKAEISIHLVQNHLSRTSKTRTTVSTIRLMLYMCIWTEHVYRNHEEELNVMSRDPNFKSRATKLLFQNYEFRTVSQSSHDWRALISQMLYWEYSCGLIWFKMFCTLLSTFIKHSIQICVEGSDLLLLPIKFTIWTEIHFKICVHGLPPY